jgi:hypothetical protein
MLCFRESKNQKKYLLSNFKKASKIEAGKNRHFKPVNSLFYKNSTFDSKVSDARDKTFKNSKALKQWLHPTVKKGINAHNLMNSVAQKDQKNRIDITFTVLKILQNIL